MDQRAIFLNGVVALVVVHCVMTTANADRIRRRACLRCGISTCYRYRVGGPTENNPASRTWVSKVLSSERFTTASTAGGTESAPTVIQFAERQIVLHNIAFEQIAAAVGNDGKMQLTGRLINHGDGDAHILRNNIRIHLRAYADSENIPNAEDGPVVFEVRRSYWLDRKEQQDIRMQCRNYCEKTSPFSSQRITRIEVEIQLRIPRKVVTSRVLSDTVRSSGNGP